MIKKLLQKIKLFFQKKRSFKSVNKICENPLYFYKLGKYIPCGKCNSCKSIRELIKTQEYIEKYRRCSPWVIKY